MLPILAAFISLVHEPIKRHDFSRVLILLAKLVLTCLKL